mmetsp:Transcript_7498/g.15578  ORF Transcript_7498/g.15578 Transcript_7498/m.15578 type:complete len:408 (+) Transcript_7498:121-1344(+)
MARRGQISIDRIVALRSSVLPLYVLVTPDGTVTTSDEVSEDGNDFLTTRMHKDQISFQSVRGDYLSVEGGQVCTRRYCSEDERFTVIKMDTQYAFKTRSGQYLSVMDREPFVGLAPSPGEQENFQLFSLMMYGVNVGKQLEDLEKSGSVVVDNLLDHEQLSALRSTVSDVSGDASGHETRISGLAGLNEAFVDLSLHPLVLQLARRALSPKLLLSDVESCCTNADYVRKELEATTWHVVHPYSAVEFPGVVDPRISFTATWFMDNLDQSNSTWAWAKAPLTDGPNLPRLPHLSSPSEVEAAVKGAQTLTAIAGSVWLYMGPMWMSNNIGAASFWKEYDAQTRYKHLSGQKDQSSFRALTDEQSKARTRDELCPTLIQATYIREYVAPRSASSLDPRITAALRLEANS